jgi:hypothetical protein
VRTPETGRPYGRPVGRDVAGRRVFVCVAALAQLGIWLLTRPDLDSAGSGAAVTWLVAEAVVGLLIGGTAEGDGRAVRAVLLGWGLQMAHYAVVVPKGEEANLWAVGLFLQAFLAVAAVVLALLAYVVARTVRSSPRA